MAFDKVLFHAAHLHLLDFFWGWWVVFDHPFKAVLATIAVAGADHNAVTVVLARGVVHDGGWHLANLDNSEAARHQRIAYQDVKVFAGESDVITQNHLMLVVIPQDATECFANMADQFGWHVGHWPTNVIRTEQM